MRNKTQCTLGIFMIIALAGFPQISETIYTPALPNIAHFLKCSMHLVEWTLSIYFIGFAAGVSFWGIQADRIGRRPAMLYGITLYCIGCLACATAPSIQMLLLFRFLQAFGASVGSVITQTMVRDTFDGVKRNKVYSIVAMALALAPGLGPLIGGFLVEWFHWQANFVFLLLMGLGLLVTGYIRLPETHPNLTKPQPKQYHTLSIAKRMLCDRYILSAAIIIGAFNGIIFSYYAEAPYIFIRVLHLSPSQYGLLGLILMCASIVGGQLSHWLNSYINTFVIALCGGCITLACAILYASFTYAGTISTSHIALSICTITLPVAGMFIGFGLTMPNVLSNALINYSEVLGRAGSILGLIYYILIALATFIMGALHNGSLYPLPSYLLLLSCVIVVFALQYKHLGMNETNSLSKSNKQPRRMS